jgi:hypothetical protein
MKNIKDGKIYVDTIINSRNEIVSVAIVEKPVNPECYIKEIKDER